MWLRFRYKDYGFIYNIGKGNSRMIKGLLICTVDACLVSYTNLITI